MVETPPAPADLACNAMRTKDLMSDQSQINQSQTPTLLRLSTLALCVLAAISALPWLYLSLGRFGGFAWGLFGFELIVLLGALMTSMVCLGKVRVAGAFPLAVACFAGTLLVVSVFGIYVDARNVVGDSNPTIQPWVKRTLLLYIAIVAGLSLIATLDVYRRSARSLGLAMRAAIFLLPLIVLGVYFKSQGLPSMSNSAGELSIVRMLSMIVGGLFVGILLSIGGHLLIRSFEVAVPEKNDQDHA